MALFKRKTNNNVLPEVEEYYQAERRDRGWLAWLLAILSVAVVVLLLVGLFWGGRWAYRQLTDDEESVAVEENEGEEDLSVDGNPTNEPEGQPAEEQPAENQGGNQAQPPAQNNEQNQGSVNAPAQTNTPSTGDTATPAPTTPKTGDDDLPNTGPASLVGVFASVSTLAGGIHYAVERRKR